MARRRRVIFHIDVNSTFLSWTAVQLMQNGLVGKKFAYQLHENANGRDDSPVETEVPEAKSISAKRTFSNDIGTEKDVDRALFNVACIVAHRMLDAVVERNNLIVGNERSLGWTVGRE